MQESTDKQFEKIIGKTIQETALEKASDKFTANIMSIISATRLTPVSVYKPVISRPSWVIIFSSFFMLAGYLISGAEAQRIGWLDNFSVNISNKLIKEVMRFQFSSTAFIVIVISTFMILIQMILLKKRYNKLYEK